MDAVTEWKWISLYIQSWILNSSETTMSQANAVMSSLMSIALQKAVIAETREEVAVDEVKLNTILAVKAGEAVPVSYLETSNVPPPLCA